MLTVAPRSSWTDTAPGFPQYPSRLLDKAEVSFLALHYPAIAAPVGVVDEATEQAWLRTIRSWHVDGNGWADIGYGLAVFQSGRAYVAGGLTHSTAHAAGQNRYAVGVLLVVGTTEDLSPAAVDTVNRLGPWLRQEHGFHALAVLTDHGRLPGQATACAGPKIRAALDRGDLSLAGGPVSTMKTYPAPSALRSPAGFRALTDVLVQEGYTAYCSPYFVDDGRCRKIVPGKPGGHPHGPRSFHWDRLAIDLGRDPDGRAVSPAEGAYLDAKVRMLEDFYGAKIGTVWNRGPLDHEDHAHLEASTARERRFTGHTIPGLLLYGQTSDAVKAWQRDLTDAGHTLTDDGVFRLATFFATKAWQAARGLVPDGIIGGASRAAMAAHLDELYPLRRFTAAEVLRLQGELARLGYAVGVQDGIPGPKFTAAVRAFQTAAGLAVDGIPGPATQAALRAALDALTAPPPPPTPSPLPPPVEVVPGRLSGATGPDTSRLVALQAPRRPKVYLTAPEDAPAAAGAGDGVVLVTRRGATNLPGVLSLALADLAPAELVIVGGSLAVPESQARQARRAANL